jgi:hypothetical protein
MMKDRFGLIFSFRRKARKVWSRRAPGKGGAFQWV